MQILMKRQQHVSNSWLPNCSLHGSNCNATHLEGKEHWSFTRYEITGGGDGGDDSGGDGGGGGGFGGFIVMVLVTVSS